MQNFQDNVRKFLDHRQDFTALLHLFVKRKGQYIVDLVTHRLRPKIY